MCGWVRTRRRRYTGVLRSLNNETLHVGSYIVAECFFLPIQDVVAHVPVAKVVPARDIVTGVYSPWSPNFAKTRTLKAPVRGVSTLPPFFWRSRRQFASDPGTIHLIS